jgi:hypothetical protein
VGVIVSSKARLVIVIVVAALAAGLDSGFTEGQAGPSSADNSEKMPAKPMSHNRSRTPIGARLPD